MVALVWFRQSLTLYCFALFSEVLTTGDPKPGPGNTSEGWEFFSFGWVFLFKFHFFPPSGRLSDKEPSFVCASVLLILLI